MLARTLSMFCLLAAGTFANAQADRLVLKGNIPFAFTVNGKSLPAGEYTFRPTAELQAVQIEPERGAGAMAGIITRLARTEHSTASDAHVVFDVADGTYTLSEIWIPDEEGFLLQATRGTHSHHVLHLGLRR